MTLTKVYLPSVVAVTIAVCLPGSAIAADPSRFDPYAHPVAKRSVQDVTAQAPEATAAKSKKQTVAPAKKSETGPAPAAKSASKQVQKKSDGKAAPPAPAPSAPPAATVGSAAPAANGAAAATPAPEHAAKPPEQWSETEIAEAKARCDVLLKGVDFVAVPEEPVRAGSCGAPAAVKLITLGKSPEVSFSPPPVLTCEMVKALDDWMKGDLQKLAKTHFGAPVTRIETMSSYSCRNAYGRAKTRLSEHGLANAIDIGGFQTSATVTTRVLGNWGLTAREIKARDIAIAKAAEEKAAAERAAAAKAQQQAPQRQENSGNIGTATPELRLRLPGPMSAEKGLGLAPNHLGGPSEKAGPKPLDKSGDKSSAPPVIPGAAGITVKPELPPSRDQKFLRAAHTSACKYFGTVLGPEANFAHHNHFHLDMAPRKHSNFCE